jgi:hypothetical protein
MHESIKGLVQSRVFISLFNLLEYSHNGINEWKHLIRQALGNFSVQR